jgi:hypothetical protein
MGLLRVLLADPRSLRALDETVADRELELAGAGTTPARVLCHLRSTFAVLRVLAMSLPREAAQSPLLWVAARGVLFAIPAALALLVVQRDIFLGFRGLHVVLGVIGDPGTDTLRRISGIFVIALGGFLPIAWFLAAAWPLERRLPIFALATVVFLVSVVQNGWLMPLARTYSPALVRFSTMTTWTVVFITIAAAYAAGLALLGAAVARLTPIQRWIWRLAVPAALMVWPRAAVWMTGWERPTATLASTIVMAGAGIVLVSIITGTALLLLARERSADSEAPARL